MPDLHVIRLIVNRKVRWIAARLALTAQSIKPTQTFRRRQDRNFSSQITRELVRTGLRKNPSLPMVSGTDLAKNPSLAQISQALN